MTNSTFLATAATKDAKGYMTNDQEAFHKASHKFSEENKCSYF